MPVHVVGLPKTIFVAGETLQVKNSFHVSLLYIKNILERSPAVEQAIIDEFCSFSKENDISFVKYTSEFRFAADRGRKTLVALCEIHNLAHFTNQLRAKLAIEIPDQPTHVTLYTLQPNLGIGLNSPQAMEQKSHQVEAPDSLVEIISRSDTSST